MLDAQGGTEIVQVAQARLRFLQGEDRLAAVRLSETGLIRWYVACCRTPIGNTLANPKVAIVGLVHSCLDPEEIHKDFGTKVAIVHANAALGSPKPKQRGLLGVIIRCLWIMCTNLASKRYKRSPFFNELGSPRVLPQTLDPGELASLKGNV